MTRTEGPRLLRCAPIAIGLLLSGCLAPGAGPGRAGPPSGGAPDPPAADQIPSHPSMVRLALPRVHVRHGAFLLPDGTPFQWRGVTAFALAEQVAHGREAEARRFLAWAHETGFTTVRVLAMASGLFRLEPEAGVRALPRVLELAAADSLAVEIVALADTASYPGLDLDAHVAAVGHAVAPFAHAVVELANEPYHPSQRRGLDDAGRLEGLRARVPAGIAVAFGAHQSDESAAYGAGDFLTVHLSRAPRTWQQVARVADLSRLARRTGTPVVNDEPIGAGERLEPGRRWAAPDPFFALGAMNRLFELGGTFHCDDCLWSRVPGPHQRAAARAFVAGLRVVPDGLRLDPWAGTGPVAAFETSRVSSVHAAGSGPRSWVVGLGVSGEPGISWRRDWREVRVVARRTGVWVWEVERVPGGDRVCDRDARSRPAAPESSIPSGRSPDDSER